MESFKDFPAQHGAVFRIVDLILDDKHRSLN